MSASVAAAAPKSRLDVVGLLSRWGTIASLVLLVVFFSLKEDDAFANSRNFINILNQVSILAILAAGLTVCLTMGLFDLSIGSIATLGGYLALRWGAEDKFGLGPYGVLLIVLLAAVVIGVANGVIVSYLGVSAFIATLATASILDGIALGYSDTATVQVGIPFQILDLGQAKFGPIPSPVVIMAVVMLVLWFFLERTQMGRHMYAIGGNPTAARLAGVRIKYYAILALSISAVCAVLGGTVADAIIGAGRPYGVGSVYLLDAFAAAFIGAATLRPGRFHILGTLVGVLLLGVINNGLSIMGAETFWQYIVKGAILIVAVFLSGTVSLRRQGV
ncbi:ABC transporter permease [Nocardioides soli]|uniref:Ribose transport system permease protein n=1 Tax=Nocardioides soli TaxID=1036020 RepID=A0A7W4Z0Z8_9ACTN|nr:ABC transporter permease [Nocardioides soli]MBB3042844.1 ribose transport system permease protein [Nocardioides soli]